MPINFLPAFIKAALFTNVWFCSFFIVSLLDYMYAPIYHDTTDSVSQANIIALSASHSYVVSIIAEAILRYGSGINWDRLPNFRLALLGAKNFGFKRLLLCLLATAIYLMLIQYTEFTSFEMIRLSFTSTSFADLPYDFKFVCVVYFGIFLRMLIYYDAKLPVIQNEQ